MSPVRMPLPHGIRESALKPSRRNSAKSPFVVNAEALIAHLSPQSPLDLLFQGTKDSISDSADNIGRKGPIKGLIG